jgi:hypothetical protein
MKRTEIRSLWGRAACLALAIFWAGAGWFILLQGGFHGGRKYTAATTFVDGGSAVFMAGLFLLLGALAGSVVLQSMRAPRWVFAVLVLVVAGPALVFLL